MENFKCFDHPSRKPPASDLLSSALHLLLHLPSSPTTKHSNLIFAQTLEPLSKKLLNPSTRETLSLSLIEKIEGCQPLLKQIWHLSLESISSQSDSNSDTYTKRISSFVSSLPALSMPLDNIKLEISLGPFSPWSWDSRLSRSAIEVFPISPYEISYNCILLTIQIEYQLTGLKPKIAKQNLGLRPRLVSFDVGEDFKDLLVFSTEQSPVSAKIQKHLSLITSESFYEENEIGFSLIHSTLADYQDSEDEAEVSRDLFDLDEEGLRPQTEDSQISAYIKMCSKVLQLKIFSESQSTDELLRQWRRN